MGVYIRGMEMPKGCAFCRIGKRNGKKMGCPLCDEEWDIHDPMSADHRLDNCPLTPVPPHGKLIDASKLIERLQKQLNEARAKVSAMGEYDIGYTPDMYIVDRDRDMIAILNAQAAFVPEEGE